MNKQQPMLMESLLTKRVYVATSYVDHGDGTFTARQKYDVTEQFDMLANTRHMETCELTVMWTDEVDGVCYKCSECGGTIFDHVTDPNYCARCGRKVVKVVTA